jgi:hypothetical protein
VSFVRGTAAAADRLIGLLFPNRCVFCGSVLDTGRCVCGGCLLELELIDGPVCGRCGAPVKPAAPFVIGGRIPAGSGGSSPAVSCPQCEDLSFGFRINESMGSSSITNSTKEDCCGKRLPKYWSLIRGNTYAGTNCLCPYRSAGPDFPKEDSTSVCSFPRALHGESGSPFMGRYSGEKATRCRRAASGHGKHDCRI